jgi:hypothetical protein
MMWIPPQDGAIERSVEMARRMVRGVAWWLASVARAAMAVVTGGPAALAALATDESGAETSVATIAWVVLGLIVVAFVVFLVFQFTGSATSAAGNVNNNLNTLPQG